MVLDSQPSTLGHPLVSMMATSGALWALGDILAQIVERLAKAAPSAASARRLDLWRTARLAVFSSCCWAPCTYLWFATLESEIPGADASAALRRMLADQCLYAPLVILALFAVVGALEGQSFRAICAKVRHGFAPTLLSNWMLWPAAQFAIQGFVSLEYRLVAANLINVPWTAYLAWKAAAQTPAVAASKCERGAAMTQGDDLEAGEADSDMEKMEVK